VLASEPQAVLTPLTEAAIFLTLTVDAGAEDEIRELLADVSGLTRSVGFRVPEGQLTCVVGVGSLLWDRLFGQPRPAGLHPFTEVSGFTHTAVATPGDLLFHIRAHRFDLCFELAQHLVGRMFDHAEVVDEVHGFRLFEERDILGFVDGTENPGGAAAHAAVVIGDEDPAFAGGSFVIVQKYLHDVAGWEGLSVEEQERVIGRSKLSDIEMSDDEKPTNSHVALNTITDDDGEQRQIMRFNMPFGKVGTREFGTYFIRYARAPDVIEEMLRNMFVGKPLGNYDRVLDFSTAVTGNLYFVPTIDVLDNASSPRAGDPDPEPSGSDAAPESSSLGIGGLKSDP
jgi:putative iron-dependent peroxidase